MANPEHVEILKQGVEVWNKWREENQDVQPNFTAVDLQRTDLQGVNLEKADLTGAKLWRANLRESNLFRSVFTVANLNEIDLQGAILSRAYFGVNSLINANLKNTDLSAAHFRDADLTRANLQGSDLTNACLHRTILKDTNLSQSTMRFTIFAGIRLDEAKGLVEIHHEAYSTVGMDTVILSKGKLPEAFLRGCGFSDLDIEYSKLANPDLTPDQLSEITYKIHDLYRGGGSIQYYSLFISYSTIDERFAQKLHDDLQDNGVRCWFAPHDIQAGKKLHEQIDIAIQHHDRLLLILSESSMNSEWVKTEIANARQKEIDQGRQVLFPISIVDFEYIKKWKCFDADTGKDSAREIREYFIPDFNNWQDNETYKEAFERLLRDLKATGGER